jgi:diaminohydroxyphosphoribosylaminopyrimidine deaminase/5-amino-6-(5-phosphoribosylamino)uracil reductase
VRKSVVCTADPAAHAGAGLATVAGAGIDVEVGLLEDAGRRLIAPFTKLMTRGLPWVHAKWAMTLDGKLATRTGDSQWISSEESRRIVHELRGRMDAIVVGIGTALADDPRLTARPAGPRTATRIIADGEARLPLESQLVRTARDVPVIVVVKSDSPAERCELLMRAGVEVLKVDADGASGLRLDQLLLQLGSRRMTHVLVEGGARLLGSFFDGGHIDEVHAFIAPSLAGGSTALTPIAGAGIALMSEAVRLCNIDVTQTGGDVYVHGDVPRVGT